MKARPDGIFWLTLIWIAGILSAHFFSFSNPILIIVCGILLVLAFIIKSFRVILLFLIIFLLAQIRFQLYNQPQTNGVESVFQIKNSFVQPVEGRIVSELTQRQRNYRFLLELSKINDVPVSGRIFFYTQNDSLQYGDIIHTIAQVQAFAEASNPYSFDFNEFMQFRKIHGSGFAKTPIEVIGNKQNPFQAAVISTRQWLRRQIEERFEKESGFFKAILIGDKSDLDELSSRLNRAGLSHLLAVSGLHVGILAFVFYLAFKLLFRNRNVARITLILSLLFYAAICNWSPSVTRAMIMISLILLAKMLQYKVNANNVIAASLLLITIINPNQLFSVGLQLSYFAVFTLINLIPNLHLWKSQKEENRLLSAFKMFVNSIFLIMFSSFVLSLVLTPLTLFHFHQFNLNGVIANVIAIPMMSFMLPLAILAILLPAGIASIYLSALRFFFFLFDKWSLWAANLPFHFTFVRFSEMQFIIAFFLILAFPFFAKKKKIQITFLSIFLVNIAVSFVAIKSSNLLITFFDCGLGDMILIETTANERIMIDTGPPDFAQGHFSQSAQGYLQNKGISTIDWLIVTHAHNDHYGGLEYILKELNVKQLVVTDNFKTRSIWHFFQPLLEKTSVFAVSDTLTLPLEGVSLKIVHPDSSYFHRNINNMSIMVRLTYGKMNILFTGDAEEEAEHHVLENYYSYLPSQVLKAGHHGSKTSSSEDFIGVVSPQYVFIPTSLRNRFHFPHEITLQKFEFLQDRMFIAGLDGALQIETDGKTGTLQTFKTQKAFFESY